MKPIFKECSLCSRELPVEAFNLRNASRDGLQPRCRECESRRKRERRRMTPEQRNADNLVRLKATANAARTSKSCSKCGVSQPLDQFHATSDGSIGGVRSACKACVKDWHALNYLMNREQYAENSHRWYANNKDLHVERVRAWRRSNPDHVIARNARRRAQVGATVELVDLDQLWIRQCGICALCLTPIDSALQWPNRFSRSLDHVIPLAKGGTHQRSNLQWTHLTCNISKGVRMPK